MASASDCFLCGRKLHNAVFCPKCASALCSWSCYVKHAVGHTHAHRTPVTNTAAGSSLGTGLSGGFDSDTVKPSG
jgi:hypothetical protein